MEKRLGRKGYEKNVAGNRDRRIDYETLAACIVEGAVERQAVVRR
ncbi:MAG TPA: hypothetical protein VKM94_16220 [Blastocatellia bacterium]|nr:hypothetical protein [Blastocatellia bacterium]